jgi:hypothetical protein
MDKVHVLGIHVPHLLLINFPVMQTGLVVYENWCYCSRILYSALTATVHVFLGSSGKNQANLWCELFGLPLHS